MLIKIFVNAPFTTTRISYVAEKHARCAASRLVYDVVEKTSTRRRSRIPCVVVEKNTTRRREGGGVIVEKIYKNRRTFNKNSYDLLTAITHTKILVAYFIISEKN